MSPEDAIKTIWTLGNPNMSVARINRAVPKVQAGLAKHGYHVAFHGSYAHMAMLMCASDKGVSVAHKKSNDTVTLRIN